MKHLLLLITLSLVTQQRIEKYKGMTLAIDEGIGQLRETLIDLGIVKNTFVLFFSDNGPAGDFPSGSPNLRGGKGSVYEGGHKVPAIAWWPGRIEASTASDQPIISIDVMPTLLALAGAASPKRPLDGVDFSGVFLRKESWRARPLFWASLSNSGKRSEAMRDGSWKLIVNHPQAPPGTFENETVELYHLNDDPGEKINLATEHPERAGKMLGLLKSWYADTQEAATPQPGGWLARKSEDGATSGNVREALARRGVPDPAKTRDRGPPPRPDASGRAGGSALPRRIDDRRPATAGSEQADETLIRSITKETVRRNRDGSGITWFHPRACMVPGKHGESTALMTLQEIGGSDYFGPVQWSESGDSGKTWSEPEPIAALGREPVQGHPDLLAGVCDVTPQFHPQTGTVLALGHVVFYRGPRFSKGDQLARYPVYAVRRRDGSWSRRKILQWDDPRGGYIYTNNCGQRFVMPNGDIMMSFTFGPQANNRMVAGVRCSFDGEELKILEVGPPLENNVGRGLLEPSLTKFQDRFYLTMRAEDGHGYVAVSDDGLNYRRKTPWAWDDGESVGMSTTQQHWLTHCDGLFLVYTRKDVSNTNVIRWRSPLWVARVDTQRLCLIRKSEQIVLPLVGDGVDNPDEVALVGNFDVTNVSPQQSWVTVGEWMPRRGAKGDLLMSRIRWSRPNSRAPNFTNR